MTEKLKVKDLPQEEQQALIREAKELKIGGVLTGFTVDSLKQKIADKKALNGDGETPAEEKDETPAEEENKDEENGDGETPVEEKDETSFNNQKVTSGVCHICRSRVEDGVCTGCGFRFQGVQQ